MSSKLSVLVCDDSALMRKLIKQLIEKDPRLSVVATAVNGLFALKKIPIVNPDVIILDLEMPEMNGIEFLKERRKRGIRIPVIILSSLAKRSAGITFDALALGASDFILKPSGSVSNDIHLVGDKLRELILVYGSKYKGFAFLRQRREGKKQLGASGQEDREGVASGGGEEANSSDGFEFSKEDLPPPSSIRPHHEKIDLVAIGISTGGPNALREKIPKLPASFPVPILIVQHMSEGFTAEFANSLNAISNLNVQEAKNGEPALPGRVYIAPGNQHMIVDQGKSSPMLFLHQSVPVNGHRPSVDVLFESVAKNFKARVLAVLMTGMGRDGARELGTLYNQGAHTFAQDESSCIVFGMPRVAIEAGYVEQVFPLNRMADKIENAVQVSRLTV